MKLPERLAESGVRYFTLAVANNFIRGRRSQYVVATCLYIVCRTEKTSHMLIDFADILQINVFVLGSTFLKFVKALHINLPLVDPSLYITRFAAMLEFGEDTHKVASDATRLVARMKRDWIDLGRRPAGICGACLIIAARMNNYRRSLAEIVHVVKVAESTVQERLADFSATASAGLTVSDFKTLWLERAENPPAYDKEKKKQGKRNRDDDETEEEDDEEAAIRTLTQMKDDDGFKVPYPINQIEQEVAQVLDSPALHALESEETQRRVQPEIDTSLEDVDDDEINSVLLDDASIAVKTQVWMANNFDYLAQQEQKRMKSDTDKRNGIRVAPKKRRRQQLGKREVAGSPVEAAKMMLQERTFSKKINYDAFDQLFS